MNEATIKTNPISRLIKSLYDWSMETAKKPYALWALAAVSFAESSFFPIPPDILLIPMVLAARTKAFRIALICTITSVIGGCFGYAIGVFLYDSVALPLLNFYGYLAKFEEFKAYYNEHGAMIVAFAGFTPFPYKVITIASGATGLDFFIFNLASIISRGARFFLVAALLWKFGEPIRSFIEKRLGLLSFLFFVLLIAGVAAVKLM